MSVLLWVLWEVQEGVMAGTDSMGLMGMGLMGVDRREGEGCRW